MVSVLFLTTGIEVPYYSEIAFVLSIVLFIFLFMVYHSSSSLLEAKGKPSPGIPSAKPAEMVTSKADSERMKKEEEKIFVKRPFRGAEVERGEPARTKCGGVLI
ncbi:MAG: hypothetical protein Q6352_008460 [Candidatus Freyrarchaeum guaymaensis]